MAYRTMIEPTKQVIVPRVHASPRSHCGFSYVMVLAALVIVGIVVEAAHVTTWYLLQADREAELLFRGQAYKRAIQSYYDASPTPVKTYPRALEDLVNDPRSPNKHHLRVLYRDPMSRDEKGEWTLVRAIDGGIAGVASRSNDEPMRKANLPAGLEAFSGAKSYAEWIFDYRPPAVPGVPVKPTLSPPISPPNLKTF